MGEERTAGERQNDHNGGKEGGGKGNLEMKKAGVNVADVKSDIRRRRRNDKTRFRRRGRARKG